MADKSAWWRSPTVIGAVLAIVAVVVADAAFRAKSGTPADPVLFLGRFHPLVVHLPIGVVVLVAAAEVVSFFPRLGPRVDPAIGLTLPVLAVSALAAFILGHMLARDGGFAPRALTLHRRLELLAVIGSCLSQIAWTSYENAQTARGRVIYRAVFGHGWAEKKPRRSRWRSRPLRLRSRSSSPTWCYRCCSSTAQAVTAATLGTAAPPQPKIPTNAAPGPANAS
jgi:hypothetical protein